MTASAVDKTSVQRMDCLVYLCNICESVNYKQLKDLIDTLDLPFKTLYIFDGVRSPDGRQLGMVEFLQPSAAVLALEELNGSRLGSCHLGMRPAKPHDLGVPHAVKKSYGIVAGSVPMSKSRISDSNAADSASPVSALSVEQTGGPSFFSKAPGSMITTTVMPGGKTIFQPLPNRVLFVTNIPFDKGDADLIKSLFTPYGDVERVRLSLTDDGEFRGFATVYMKNVTQASLAQKGVCGSDFCGRQLLVIFDKFNENR